MVTLPPKIEETRLRLYFLSRLGGYSHQLQHLLSILRLGAFLLFVHCRFAVTVPLMASLWIYSTWSNIPVPGHLWAHHLSPTCLALVVLNQGPSTNADVFLVPVEFPFWPTRLCPQVRRGTWGKEGSFPTVRDCNWSPLSEIRFKEGSYFELSIPPKQLMIYEIFC